MIAYGLNPHPACAWILYGHWCESQAVPLPTQQGTVSEMEQQGHKSVPTRSAGLQVVASTKISIFLKIRFFNKIRKLYQENISNV